MSKLILFSLIDQVLENGATYAVPCTLDDEINFSHRLGEQIIIASIGAGLAPGYTALGKLQRFSIDAAGNSHAHIESISPFLDTISFLQPSPKKPQISNLDNDLYDEIISVVLGAKDAEEAFAGSFIASPVDRIFAQAKRDQQGYCSFSDMATKNGVATYIRPPELGGKMHVSNLLFLDGEPSELFKSFAWTLGRSYEIIIDLYTVTPDFAATVNRAGKLVLRSRMLLDQDALAWHRQQFAAKRLG